MLWRTPFFNKIQRKRHNIETSGHSQDFPALCTSPWPTITFVFCYLYFPPLFREFSNIKNVITSDTYVDKLGSKCNVPPKVIDDYYDDFMNFICRFLDLWN